MIYLWALEVAAKTALVIFALVVLVSVYRKEKK